MRDPALSFSACQLARDRCLWRMLLLRAPAPIAGAQTDRRQKNDTTVGGAQQSILPAFRVRESGVTHA